MAIFKCKMCGGTLEINENQSIAECEYCGTTQTLPKTDNEQKLNLINRANHFRQQCEFDKAMELYEKLLNSDDSDSEIYWSIVLCRYGIEYVDDPLKHVKIPTCHRAQWGSILADADYLSAIEHSDSEQREIYRKEAEYIDTVQKGILEISNKEEPFDVFICYKESDDSGKRTQDSVLAQDLYYQLTQEGFKVFFSRITLEGKLGTAYEPYIFAALNSAKVMVAVGTKPEYFNAVWVRNEWSRFLMLMQEDRSKTIIPAYRDMDPYDLPDALSMFQAQDMSKLGFMQDLIRGIGKIAKDEPKQTVVKETVVMGGNAQTAPLLKRAFMFLEDGDWSSANEYCEKVLDIEPECTDAYVGKLLAELHTRKKSDLPSLSTSFADNDNYKKAVRFGDDTLKAELSGYVEFINERNENERLTNLYNSALNAMNSAKTENEYKSAGASFRKISDFMDSAQKAEECLEKAEIARKEAIYQSARDAQSRDNIFTLQSAIEKLKSIADYKNSAELMEKCRKRLEELRTEELAKEQLKAKEARRKARRNKIIAISCAAVILSTIIGVNIHRSNVYKESVSAYESGEYDKAIEKFAELDNYKDSVDKKIDAKYCRAVELFEEKKFYASKLLFEQVSTYQDASLYLAKAEYASASIGDIVTFGNYTWHVINKTKDGCTLLSEKAVTEKSYNEKCEDITWENCTLRQWLNTDFYNQFSEEEKAMIAKTKLKNPDNPEYGTKGGNDTEDYIYLLSIDEAAALSEDIRACGTWWWLRSPGNRQYCAAYVYDAVSLDTRGDYVHYDYAGVSPALNIKFE